MMPNFTKYLCAILTAAALSPPAVYADAPVNISPWAYNDVTAFINDGLLPESLEAVTDYRKAITREQFCELMYNIVLNSKSITPPRQSFIDSDNPAVNYVITTNSYFTEQVVLDLPIPSSNPNNEELEAYQSAYEYYKQLYAPAPIFGGNYVLKANPSQPMLREEAAFCLANISYLYDGYSAYDSPAGISYTRASSDKACAGIYASLMNGLMDASENADEYMTIEQAITAAKRLRIKLINSSDSLYLSAHTSEAQFPYRKPDGWIYYSNWNDNGKMYRIDSNGENKQLLCDEDCFDTTYADGRLYYSIRGENEQKLFCIKADGTEKEQVSQSEAYIIKGSLAGSREVFSDAIDGRVYYIEADQLANRSKAPGYLWSIRHTDSGAVKEQISDIPLSPLARDEACIYLKNPVNGDGYILDKNGLQKLNLNGTPITIRIFREGAECTTYLIDGEEKTLCAPRGSSEFTDCTHEHLYTNPNLKNSYTYTVNHSLSDENYQIGTSGRLGEGAWIYNRKTAEFKTNVFKDKLLARANDILYLKSDSKIYAYNLDTGEKKAIADNVLSTDTVSGSVIPFIDADKNLCCLDLNSGIIRQCSATGNAARYGEFASLKQDSFTKHLIKRCSNGGYFDLTNASAEYYGYVAY